MDTRQRALDQLRKLWSYASEVLKFEIDLTWLDTLYEDDTIRDEEKTREARVKFIKFSFKLLRQEKRVKKLEDDAKNEESTDREEDEASGGSSDSKGDDVQIIE